jgi:hypothetical protein
VGCVPLSEHFVLQILTCAGPVRWAYAGCDIFANSSWEYGCQWRSLATVQGNSSRTRFFRFWLEVSLNFSINSFDLSMFFLLREDDSPAATASGSSKVLKTEPLSPITDELDFAYASDIVESNSRDPGHIVELSY